MPGKEHLFEERMHAIHRAARTFPGHMGVTTIKAPGRDDSFQTVLRFDTQDHLEQWLNSPTRRPLMQSLEEVAHNDTTTKATGLETWFNLPGQHTVPPPRWKMVVVTFVAVYPLSLISVLFVAPHTENLPVLVRAIFFPAVVPIILTYLFMPFLTQRVFKRWLYRDVS
jgi:antibiotic biosynthesis monooxygenase (ABM) superfamily enzyme